MWRRGLFAGKSFRRIASYKIHSQPASPLVGTEPSSLFQCQRRALCHSIMVGRTDSLVYESSQVLCRFQHTGVDIAEPEPESSATTSAFENKMDELIPLLQEAADESFESKLHSILDGEDELVRDLISLPFQIRTLNYLSVIRLMNWAIERYKHLAGQTLTTSLIETLVRTVLTKSTAVPLWNFVKKCALEFNVIPSEVSQLNKLIFYLTHQVSGGEILEIFYMISQLGLIPNSESYYLTIVALCKGSCYDQAYTICHSMLEAEAVPEIPSKIGYIIRLLCKAENASLAQHVYTRAKALSKQLPLYDFSLLISSLTRKDETVKLAADTLYALEEKDLNAANRHFYLVLCGLCRMKDINEANKVLSHMISVGPPPGNDIFNRIISCYSKIGDMEGAVRSMKLMESRGLRPDVFTYTVIIGGYVRAGRMEEALEILSLAKQNHSKLTPVTYHSLIRGYCKLEQFDNAMKLLSEMKNFGVIPNVNEYSKLIQSLCVKALDWETSENLLKEMEKNGLHLNGITKGLIGAVKELEQEQAVAV